MDPFDAEDLRFDVQRTADGHPNAAMTMRITHTPTGVFVEGGWHIDALGRWVGEPRSEIQLKQRLLRELEEELTKRFPPSTPRLEYAIPHYLRR